MKKILLAIGGMSCSACSNGLEKYLHKQKGIQNASVNLVMANALIEYDETILDQEKIEKFVQEAGFESLGLYEEKGEKKREKAERRTFWIFTVLAIVFLYVSMGHMVGLPIWHILDMHKNPINYTITLFILTYGRTSYILSFEPTPQSCCIYLVPVYIYPSISMVWERHFKQWMEELNP